MLFRQFGPVFSLLMNIYYPANVFNTLLLRLLAFVQVCSVCVVLNPPFLGFVSRGMILAGVQILNEAPMCVT